MFVKPDSELNACLLARTDMSLVCTETLVMSEPFTSP